jgi:hypothetical protein
MGQQGEDMLQQAVFQLKPGTTSETNRLRAGYSGTVEVSERVQDSCIFGGTDAFTRLSVN